MNMACGRVVAGFRRRQGGMSTEFIAFWNSHPWGRLGLTVSAALLVAFAIRSLAFAFLRRLAAHRPFTAGLVGHANPPMEWLIPLLMLTVALRVTPDIDQF